jgi:mannosyltransferase OCH1-like enzyme
MNQSKETANFFWDGSDLGLYEERCISSFIKHNFSVNVWSFQLLTLPKGAELKDANQFLDIEYLYKITQGGKPKSIAAFSDLFRYKVLEENGGWWFDTDCICLKDQLEFKSLLKNKNIVVGYESTNYINGAVLSFVDKSLAKESFEKSMSILQNNNFNIKWGDIGPRLITSIIQEKKLENEIYTEDYFYPIHYKDAMTALNVNHTIDINSKTKNSYVYHCWNEILKKHNVDKRIPPPENTFIYEKFYGY